MKKIILYSLLAIALLFIILNPSLKSFKEFRPLVYYQNRVITERRLHNYIFFSVYQFHDQREGDNEYQYTFLPTETYIGILGNFYKTTSND